MPTNVAEFKIFNETGTALRSYLLAKHNLEATAAPTVGDDVDDGYSIGSIWADITNKKVYVCRNNAAGAADWYELAASGGGGTVTVPGGGTGATSHTDNAVLIGNGTSPIESSTILTQTATGLQVGNNSGAPTINLAGGDAGGGVLSWSEDGSPRGAFTIDHDTDTVTVSGGYQIVVQGAGGETAIKFDTSTTSSDPVLRVYDTSGVVRASVTGDGTVDAESFVGDGSGLTGVTVTYTDITGVPAAKLLGNSFGSTLPAEAIDLGDGVQFSGGTLTLKLAGGGGLSFNGSGELQTSGGSTSHASIISRVFAQTG